MSPGRSRTKKASRRRVRFSPLELISSPDRLLRKSPIKPNAVGDSTDDSAVCKPVKMKKLLPTGSTKWFKNDDDMIIEQGQNQPGRIRRTLRKTTRLNDQSRPSRSGGNLRDDHSYYALRFPVRPSDEAVQQQPEEKRRRGRPKAVVPENETGRGGGGDEVSALSSTFTQLRPSAAGVNDLCVSILSSAVSTIQPRSSAEHSDPMLTSYFPVTKHASDSSRLSSKKAGSPRSNQSDYSKWSSGTRPQQLDQSAKTTSQHSESSTKTRSQPSNCAFTLLKNFLDATSDDDPASSAPEVTATAATILVPDSPEEEYGLGYLRRREKARKTTAKKKRCLKRLGHS